MKESRAARRCETPPRDWRFPKAKGAIGTSAVSLSPETPGQASVLCRQRRCSRAIALAETGKNPRLSRHTHKMRLRSRDVSDSPGASASRKFRHTPPWAYRGQARHGAIQPARTAPTESESPGPSASRQACQPLDAERPTDARSPALWTFGPRSRRCSNRGVFDSGRTVSTRMSKQTQPFLSNGSMFLSNCRTSGIA